MLSLSEVGIQHAHTASDERNVLFAVHGCGRKLADIDCFIATDMCLPAKDFTYLFYSTFSSFLPVTARYLLTP